MCQRASRAGPVAATNGPGQKKLVPAMSSSPGRARHTARRSSSSPRPVPDAPLRVPPDRPERRRVPGVARPTTARTSGPARAGRGSSPGAGEAGARGPTGWPRRRGCSSRRRRCRRRRGRRRRCRGRRPLGRGRPSPRSARPAAAAQGSALEAPPERAARPRGPQIVPPPASPLPDGGEGVVEAPPASPRPGGRTSASAGPAAALAGGRSGGVLLEHVEGVEACRQPQRPDVRRRHPGLGHARVGPAVGRLRTGRPSQTSAWRRLVFSSTRAASHAQRPVLPHWPGPNTRWSPYEICCRPRRRPSPVPPRPVPS
jgi:hypothetical protein